MHITYLVSLLKIEVKTVLLLLPFVVALLLLIPNFTTHQTLAQSPTQSNEQKFASSFQGIVDDTISLTDDYDDQLGKWKIGELSNETMASITDTYLPRYQELIKRTSDLQTPKGYENVTNLYAKSIESELESNTHFRNYLLTGNATENEAYEQSGSDALRYEIESFKVFYSASNATNK